MKRLAGLGLEVDARDPSGHTPLHIAARRGDDIELVRTLVDLGADINATSGDGLVPLELAARHAEDPGIISALVRAGADPNEPGFEILGITQDMASNREQYMRLTALHLAALSNPNPEVILRRIEEGADPKADSEFGLPWSLIKDRPMMMGTAAYWTLSDARFE